MPLPPLGVALPVDAPLGLAAREGAGGGDADMLGDTLGERDARGEGDCEGEAEAERVAAAEAELFAVAVLLAVPPLLEEGVWERNVAEGVGVPEGVPELEGVGVGVTE